ncbi:MAG: MFS transporter [Brevinematia bacterium]
MGKKEKVNKNVLMTGFTSFFTDISSEMIYPLIQAFVSSILKSQAALIGPVLGLIEGIAESTASILKLFSGYISDRIKKRKILAIIGYSLSAVSKILFFIPYWFTVFTARIIDRIGKGIRTAPRDALISDSVSKDKMGKAFGFQRGMDFAGAFLGTLVSFLLIKFVFKDLDSVREPAKFYPIFAIALIPALIGVIFLFFTKDVKVEKKAKLPTFNLKKYNKSLRVFFLAQFIFTLGNSSNQFLLLRSTNLGHSLSTITIMYLLFNLTTTIFSTPLGALSDKIGRKGLLILGYFMYAVVYTGFGIVKPNSNWVLWILWIVYGLYYAMTEGLEKAFVSDLAPENSKATAIGFYHMIVGVTLLPASLIAGFLYSLNPVSPFLLGGILALINCIILLVGLKNE